MAKKKQSAPQAEPQAAPQIDAYKGFSPDLTCRGFQYEIGGTYRHEGPAVRCTDGGFHSCEMPLDVWGYYGPATSRFALVSAGGAVDRAKDGDTKIASAEITIKAEIKIPEMVRRAVAWIVERAKTNLATGDSGHAAATGDSGHAAATGDSGHAAATGDWGHAAATGDRGHAAATGARGHAAATGDRGHAAATGARGHAAVKGRNAIAASLGIASTAQAEEGGWVVLAAYDDDYELVAVRAAKVGGPEGIKPGVRYRLTTDGEFVEAAP